MVGTEFHDQAKGFADALLAGRTAMIVRGISQEDNVRLTPEDSDVLKMATGMLDSCIAGSKTAEGNCSEPEMGFLEWMEALRHYETAFDAIVRSRLANKERDIRRTLDCAKNKLERILAGDVPEQVDDILKLFNFISEVSLDAAQDSIELPPQELSAPAETKGARE